MRRRTLSQLVPSDFATELVPDGRTNRTASYLAAFVVRLPTMRLPEIARQFMANFVLRRAGQHLNPQHAHVIFKCLAS